MADIRYSRTVPRPLPFEWWQAGEVAPIDCTGFACAVEESTLGWTPGVTVANAALGQFSINAPSPAQAAGLTPGRRYAIRVVLRNGAGDAIEDFRLTLVAV